jgi:CubicO group peptidase (beta-lactamase class C family)
VRDGDKAVGGFGGAGPETSFQIGSVTKVFTALVLADMAERGEVHLSDPAARYLPGGATAGPTLADLATHTSGLPRGLLPSALLHPGDPYARYPVGGLVRDARRALRAAPPAGSAQRPYRPRPARRLGVAALANSAGSPPSPLDHAVLSAFGS